MPTSYKEIKKIVVQLFSDGINDPKISEIAAKLYGEHFKIGEAEELEVIVHLKTVLRYLKEDDNFIVVLLSNYYYRKATKNHGGCNRQLPLLIEEGDRCLCKGGGGRDRYPTGLKLITDLDDVIFKAFLARNGRGLHKSNVNYFTKLNNSKERGFLSHGVVKDLKDQLRLTVK